MTPLPPHLLSSIDRINAALEVAVAQPPPATATDTSFDPISLNGLLTLDRSTSSSLRTLRTRCILNSQGRRWCPDLSYGPRRTTPESVLPPGVPIFDDFRTIKIEIGVSQPWGMVQGQLDHKTISIWAVMPGVEYMCVEFDPDFANAEYKLYDARVNPLVQLAPLPIVAPRTVIQLDGRRILGILPGMALSIAFPATLSVDLYSPLVWAMR
ncbi:hypothetical protein PC116_g19484 [Phytophthora cactorum]|nr:hypothetical protein PC112_g13815 [Phytophthora cactorum]KAG3148627.1 hypothetical protein C6341_g17336 [Phytophthora cactorum]KAG3164854.1 hypothetical protein PC128_g20052 [Phytophthora cactorum]KAG4232268.1 hypothetical protein PC116_g19484 [Phytophthora cactorum]